MIYMNLNYFVCSTGKIGRNQACQNGYISYELVLFCLMILYSSGNGFSIPFLLGSYVSIKKINKQICQPNGSNMSLIQNDLFGFDRILVYL